MMQFLALSNGFRAGGGWQGLGPGRGRLSRRELVISRRGRGAAALPLQATVWIPRPLAEPEPEAITAPVLEAVG